MSIGGGLTQIIFRILWNFLVLSPCLIASRVYAKYYFELETITLIGASSGSAIISIKNSNLAWWIRTCTGHAGWKTTSLRTKDSSPSKFFRIEWNDWCVALFRYNTSVGRSSGKVAMKTLQYFAFIFTQSSSALLQPPAQSDIFKESITVFRKRLYVLLRGSNCTFKIKSPNNSKQYLYSFCITNAWSLREL